MLKLCAMNTTTLDPVSNAALVSCYEGGDADDQREPFGDLPQQTALGVTAIPYPPDANGRAEAIVAVGIGGTTGRIVGAWDTRASPVVGNMVAGDTALHSTDPNQSAQVLLKGDSQSAALVVKDSSGGQHLLSIDGASKSFTLLVSGHAIGVDKSGIHMTSANGQNGVSITNDSVHIKGTVVLGGMVPVVGQQLGTGTAAQLAASPVAGLIPVPGVFVGL